MMSSWKPPIGWSPLKRSISGAAVPCCLITQQFNARIIAEYAILNCWSPMLRNRTRPGRAVEDVPLKEPALFGSGWAIGCPWFKPGFHPWDMNIAHVPWPAGKESFSLVAARIGS